jgi:hypothetical protein
LRRQQQADDQHRFSVYLANPEVAAAEAEVAERARLKAEDPAQVPFTSVTCTLPIATSVPVPIAMPTFARERGRAHR